MGKYDILIFGGIAAVAGGFFFFTKPGKKLLGELTSGIEGGTEWDAEEMGFEDPFKYLAEDPDAFTPGTSAYQEIIRRNRGKKAASALFRKL